MHSGLAALFVPSALWGLGQQGPELVASEVSDSNPLLQPCLAGEMADMMRSPTFLVNAEKQNQLLEQFQKKSQHLSEEYQQNKPLCFSARAYQKTHPGKMHSNHKDADVTLASPMLLGVADGVSQMEEFGLDASALPRELLLRCEEIAMDQLFPNEVPNQLTSDGCVSCASRAPRPWSQRPQSKRYNGPVHLLKEAYETSESLGSTTVLLAVLDNSTRIHGKLHPMVAVLNIGDSEMLMLRRVHGRQSFLEAVFHTEMQRIDGHVQTPLQLARVDERVDPDFDEELAMEVIERGSAVHCVSAYEGDIVVLGSDGIFDNLFLEEVVEVCNEMLPPSRLPDYKAVKPELLTRIAKRLVDDAHAKSEMSPTGGLLDTPIGRGGKMDDTSVVVGEVVEWTATHSDVWSEIQRTKHSWPARPAMPVAKAARCGPGFMPTCGVGCRKDNGEDSDEYEEEISPRQWQEHKDNSEDEREERKDDRCTVQ